MAKVVCIEGAFHSGGLPSFWSEPSERTPMTKARAGARRGALPKAQRPRKSHRVEAHRATIMAVLEASPDSAIDELRHSLSKEGLCFGYGTIRRSSSVTRSRAKRDSHDAEQDRPDASKGDEAYARVTTRSIGIVSSSCVRPGHRPKWREHMVASGAANACGHRTSWPLENVS